jgi:subtilisin family serine protease
MDGSEQHDYSDRRGHGTAVAAAIREKAPAAELLAVKIFDRTLATNAELLARGIEWAGRHGARLINLSLGTANLEREAVLREAVEDVTARGAMVVAAFDSDGRPWLPGILPGVAGVSIDWHCPRDELAVRVPAPPGAAFRASAYPRPIDGVPPERNLSGISFSVANVTGFLARVIERDSSLRTVLDVVRRMCDLE